MRPRLIIFAEPGICISLQLLQARIELLAKRHTVELILHGAMKAFADPVGLRRSSFRLGVIDIFDRQIELILVVLALAANSVPRSVRMRVYSAGHFTY